MGEVVSLNPLLAPDTPRALIALEDGTVMEGRSTGVPGEAFGELVFNTAMAATRRSSPIPPMPARSSSSRFRR